jgi:hypothetical protein
MKTGVNLDMYRNVDTISAELKTAIHALEQDVDDFCCNFVKTQEDLQLVSLFQSMLNDLYNDLENINNIRGLLYN